jgi:antitoxin VapB
MTSIAKLLMQGHSQVVLLPEGIHFEGTEVRISKVGETVILEPVEKKPVDAAAWRTKLEEYRDVPFMEDGRDQGTELSAPVWTAIDPLRNGEDLFPEDGFDGSLEKPVERDGS